MPGPNRYGSVRSNDRKRVAGCVQRVVGTSNPTGRSGVGASAEPGSARSVAGSRTAVIVVDGWFELLVLVVGGAVLVVEAVARCLLVGRGHVRLLRVDGGDE